MDENSKIEAVRQPHKRQFIWMSQAWYGPANLLISPWEDELHLAAMDAEGVLLGEISIPWLEITGVSEVKFCSDSWGAAASFADFFSAMAARGNQPASPADVVAMLISLGVEDATPRTRAEDDPVFE